MASENIPSYDCCGACASNYQDPRILSCLHSFCLQCIEKMVEGTAYITCPICSEYTTVPKGGPASLHNNIRLNDQEVRNGILRKMFSSPGPQCDCCEGEDSHVVAYCTVEGCDGFLCDLCLGHHQKKKKTREHTTITLEEAQKQSQQVIMENLQSSFPNPSKCSTHLSNLEFYCIDCSKPICVHCVATHHKDHSACDTNTEKSAQKKGEIQQSVEGFENIKEILGNAVEEIESMKKSTDERETEVNTTIVNVFSELGHLLSERKDSLLNKSKSIAESKRQNLAKQLNAIQYFLGSANQCHSLAKDAASEYSGVQALSIASPVCERAADLKKKFKGITLDLCETSDISVEVDTDTVAAEIQRFGSVADTTPCCSNVSTVIPRNKLCIGAEMTILVISKDDRGNLVDKGGSVVRGKLMKDGEQVLQCPVVDRGDGTYQVSVNPTLVEQYELSISIHGQEVHGSPFNLRVVPPQAYTTIDDPLQIISGIKEPQGIAFSNAGDMYVTSQGDHCVYVFNRTGQKIATIGSSSNTRENEPRFKMPCGIDVCCDIAYVADCYGHKIHIFAIGGGLLNTYGKEGSDVGDFYQPYDVKISPENKIYVSDTGNNRVQVFDINWVVLHIINNFRVESYFPRGVSFGLLCDVHVTGNGSGMIKVFSSTGEFDHEYGKEDCSDLSDIAIDAAGHSMVVGGNFLSVFDTRGRNIHSVEGYNQNCGISVSPNGSVWIAHHAKNRLVKVLMNYFFAH